MVTLLRLWFNFLIALSIFFFPWWISVGLIVFLLFVVQAPEILLWGLALDILYGTALPSFFNIVFIFTLLFFVLFIIVGYSKRFLVFYPS